jgi:four helix bundle protein
MERRHVPIEEMDFFTMYAEVADWAWRIVSAWPYLAQRTVGEQLIRAIDRVGATLVEGDGRYSDAEAAHFFVIARGSARETRYWIQRAVARELVRVAEGQEKLEVLVRATRQLNGLIRYRRTKTQDGKVQESTAGYQTEGSDPFVE